MDEASALGHTVGANYREGDKGGKTKGKNSCKTAQCLKIIITNLFQMYVLMISGINTCRELETRAI